jgi:hypothetical protein
MQIPIQFNDPETVAELQQFYPQYETALGLPWHVICGRASRAAHPPSWHAMPRNTCSRGSGGRKRSFPQRSAKAPAKRA